MNKEEICRIIPGAVYRFTSENPLIKGCHNHLYRVLHLAMLVPVYQSCIVVEAMSGPDKGKVFCVTEINFALRYAPLSPPNGVNHADGPR